VSYQCSFIRSQIPFEITGHGVGDERSLLWLDGNEYVTWAFATSSVVPRENSSTSATASLRPSFNKRARAIRSVNCGLRRKSMCRLVVTANRTGPTFAIITSHALVSASIIIVGPERVPPGRPCRSEIAMLTTTVSADTSSTWATPDSGNAASRMCWSSSTPRIGTSNYAAFLKRFTASGASTKIRPTDHASDTYVECP
jgi:hypothetical protein